MKHNFLSHTIQQIKPSATLELTALANSLKQEGKQVVSFGAGEPDFDTPEDIKQGAIQAIKNGETKYSPVPGLLSLREKIADTISQEVNISYKANNVVVGVGAKQVLYNTFMSLLNPGEEVIFSAPYWVSYPDMVLLAGGKSVILPTTIDNHYKITAQQLDRALTPKTKIFLINSPSNPTGVLYSKAELESIASVLRKHPNVVIVSDDIYGKLLYDKNEFYNIAMVDSDIAKRTVIINGFSKTFAMTGWRIGYAVSSNIEIIKAIAKIQAQSTSGATTFAQRGAEVALTSSSVQDDLQKFVSTFQQRRDRVVQQLKAIEGIQVIKPDGAFYVFPSIKAIIETDKFKSLAKERGATHNSHLFTSLLLEKYLVAAVPGNAFGDDNAFRISYVISDKDCEKGIEGIAQLVKELT